MRLRKAGLGSPRIFRLAASFLWVVAGAFPAERTPLELEYHLRLRHLTTHLVEVEIVAAQVNEPQLDFVMPDCSPGRYAIYDFAKNLQEFEARGAQRGPLPWTNLGEQTRQMETRESGGGGADLRVRRGEAIEHFIRGARADRPGAA